MMRLKLMVPLALFVASLMLASVDCRRKDKGVKLRANGKRPNCEYSHSAWSQCGGEGVSVRVQELKLVLGDPKECPESRLITKPCRNRARGGNGANNDDDNNGADNGARRSHNHRRKMKKKKDRKVKGCKYGRKSDWSECGDGVASRHRVRLLKEGSPDHCPKNRTVTKPCRGHRKNNNNDDDLNDNNNNGGGNNKRMHRLKKKGRAKGCKYVKGPWQPCNKLTNLKKRELTLRRGDVSICSAVRTIEKPCRRRAQYMHSKTSQCQYEAMAWGECSSRTNTMTRVLKLKSGDPALCQQSKELTRKCRKPCKFSKGDWGECDSITGMKQRTDLLSKGDKSMCEASRVISKMCGKEEKCHYQMGNWSDCDPVSKMRSRVKTLTSGDPDKCQPDIQIQRPCLKPNGDVACFLGSWGEFGQCQNGVMMKHRPVIAGGVECERKAVKAKPCP